MSSTPTKRRNDMYKLYLYCDGEVRIALRMDSLYRALYEGTYYLKTTSADELEIVDLAERVVAYAQSEDCPKRKQLDLFDDTDLKESI